MVAAEEFFGIDEYVDQAKVQKPVIYISQYEIFAVHNVLLDQLQDLVKHLKK